MDNDTVQTAGSPGDSTPPMDASGETIPGTPAAAESEELADLQARAAKADENWDRYLRAVADLENFKKRAAREKQDAMRIAHESVLHRLLPVLDNLDMAAAAVENAQGDVASLRTGVTMIVSQLRSALTEAGLEEVDATGKPFDPNLHEAVSQVEAVDVPEGHVVQQLRKGYRHRDRLLRPATVVVARAAAPAAASSTDVPA